MKSISTMIKTKPFCQFLFETYDKPTKAVVYDFLLKWYTSDVHPDLQPNEYGRYDFVMYKGEDEIKIEVQRKLGWTDRGRWQRNFNTIDIEYRKRTSEADLFCIVNASMDTIAIIRRDVVMASPIVEKNTRYGREPFFNIPIFKAYISSL